MIKIKKEKAHKKDKEPYYLLKYNYMIGDANGHTSEKVEVSFENPFLERYVKLVNSLKPTKGHWDVMLTEERIKDCFKEKQISEDDYNFLLKMMFEEPDEESKFSVEEKDAEFAGEFFEGVQAEAEYSFLVFEDLDLFYIDEKGKKHETEIVD